MWNRIGRATKAISVLALMATLIGASSSVGAFATTESSEQGESSTVGSSGYANAYVTYANAYVTGPSSGPVSASASSPTAAAAVARGSSASATVGSGTASVPAPTSVQAPSVVVRNTTTPTGSPTTTVQVVAADETTDALRDAIEKLEELGVDLPDLPDLPLPPVDGLAVKAAILALLTTIQTQTLATITVSEAVSLAAIEHAREQVILAFADLDMPEAEAAALARIDDARTKTVAAYAQARTGMTTAFDQARAAVIAKDPAELDDLPGEVIPLITAAQLLITQKLTQAQAALAAVLAQFA